MTPRLSSIQTWDTRVVYIERQRRWWWNAWLESAETELYGFAESHEEASKAMNRAIREAEKPPPVRELRPCPRPTGRPR